MSTIGGEGATGAADPRPLSDQEYQLLQRLLSDPFSLPIQFKSWLIAYLETSDLTLPMSAILGLQALLGISGTGQGTLGVFPAGIILPFGGLTAPTGSLLCDGTAYTITSQQRLYDAISTNFGSAGTGTFRVPDLQERIPVGRGAMGAHDTVGKSEGQPLGQRGTAHQHGPHQHQQTHEIAHFNAGSDAYSIMGSGSLSDGPLTNPTQVGPTGTPMHTPAFLTVNFIIVS